MYVISFTNKFPVGDFSGQLKFFYSAFYDGTEEHFAIELGEVTIGNERDNEVTLSVNNVDLELKLDDADFPKWLNILKELTTVKVTVQLYIGGIEFFGGYVQQNSVKGDMFRKKIKFRCIDQISKLKEVDPRDNPLGYGTSEKVNILQLFRDIFTTDTFFEFPYIDDVVSLSTLEARKDATNYIGYDNFGIVPYRIYFSPTSPYTSMIAVVKSLCVSYGLIPYIGTDATLYLIPRVYQNNTVFEFENNRIKDIEPYITRKMFGLKMLVWTLEYDPFNYETYNYGDVITDPERVETIRSDQPGGELPGGGNGGTSVFLWDGSTWVNSVEDSFRRKNADGSYTSENSLWKLVGDDTWAAIQNDRINWRVTLPGQFNLMTRKSELLSTHNPNQFYKLAQFPDDYLRPRRFKYDLNKNEVEIDLLSN